MIIDKSCYPTLATAAVMKIDRDFQNKSATLCIENSIPVVYCTPESVFSAEEKNMMTSILGVSVEYRNKLFMPDGKQNAPKPKETAGKPILSLVPRGIVEAIAKVREFGNKKYGNPDGWKMQNRQDYWEACLRHVEKARNNIDAVDEESNLPHIYHLACDLSFILSGEIK